MAAASPASAVIPGAAGNGDASHCPRWQPPVPGGNGSLQRQQQKGRDYGELAHKRRMCTVFFFYQLHPLEKEKKELRPELLENKWCHLVEVDEGCRVAACSTDEVSRV